MCDCSAPSPNGQKWNCFLSWRSSQAQAFPLEGSERNTPLTCILTYVTRVFMLAVNLDRFLTSLKLLVGTLKTCQRIYLDNKLFVIKALCGI